MSSAMSPLPREMSSSASSLLPIAEAPVTSTPISSTSRKTPWSVVDSASTRERKSRNTSTRCGDGWTDVKSAMWLASHFAARMGRHGFAVGDDDRDQLQREQPLDRGFELAFRQGAEISELRRAQDLDAERMDEIHVADLADGRPQLRLAGQHAVSALAPGDPVESEPRLVVGEDPARR